MGWKAFFGWLFKSGVAQAAAEAVLKDKLGKKGDGK